MKNHLKIAKKVKKRIENCINMREFPYQIAVKFSFSQGNQVY